MKIIPCRQKRESMEKLDKERYLKRVIIVCWIALAICFGIKLFGGNLFKIMCENENFIKVCEYADNHWWAYYLINALNSFVLTYFYTLAVCQKLKYDKWQLIVIIATVFVGTMIKYYSNTIGLIFDVWQMIIMPCLFTIKTPKKHWNTLIGNILVLIFQMVSLFVKNIGLRIITRESTLLVVIFSIDVFLMVILYYLYANIIEKKGGEKKWE